MRVVIPGGSGQIGRLLCRDFIRCGWDVVVLTRSQQPPDLGDVRCVHWDGRNPGDWCAEIDSADIVIQLAGRSVDCRYTEANRKAILESRVDSTRAVAAAIASANNAPRLLLQASTATIYSHRYDHPNDDIDGVIGGDEPDVPESWRFSIDVARAWEAAAQETKLPDTRLVLMRSAMTMSPDRGGVFDVLMKLVRFGLGGTSGDGRQFVSWIHDVDFVGAVHWLIEQEPLDGAINLCSPHPIPNKQFMRTLRDCWGQRFGLPASRSMLEMGAMLMRTETELVLKSRRVVPTRLADSGFNFQFPSWSDAAADLCRRYADPS